MESDNSYHRSGDLTSGERAILSAGVRQNLVQVADEEVTLRVGRVADPNPELGATAPPARTPPGFPPLVEVAPRTAMGASAAHSSSDSSEAKWHQWLKEHRAAEVERTLRAARKEALTQEDRGRAVAEREELERRRACEFEELQARFASTGLRGPPPEGERPLEVRMGSPWRTVGSREKKRQHVEALPAGDPSRAASTGRPTSRGHPTVSERPVSRGQSSGANSRSTTPAGGRVSKGGDPVERSAKNSVLSAASSFQPIRGPIPIRPPGSLPSSRAGTPAGSRSSSRSGYPLSLREIEEDADSFQPPGWTPLSSRSSSAAIPDMTAHRSVHGDHRLIPRALPPTHGGVRYSTPAPERGAGEPLSTPAAIPMMWGPNPSPRPEAGTMQSYAGAPEGTAGGRAATAGPYREWPGYPEGAPFPAVGRGPPTVPQEMPPSRAPIPPPLAPQPSPMPAAGTMQVYTGPPYGGAGECTGMPRPYEQWPGFSQPTPPPIMQPWPQVAAPQMPPPQAPTLPTVGSTPASQWMGSHPQDFGAGDRVLKPVHAPDKYDGSGFLGEYLAHFDMCRRANGWSNAQAGLFLGLSLTGKARRLLTGRETASAEGYMHLRAALIARFQPANQSAMYKALLRAKERGKGDCLQSHAEDVERLTRLAYPNADVGTIDVMAKDRFIESLKDAQLQQWVHQGKAETLVEAVQSALHAEACLRPHGKIETARAVNATVAEAMEAMREDRKRDRAEGKAELEALRQAIAGQTHTGAGRTGRGVPRPTNRGPLRCWHCGEIGHIREKCSAWLALVSKADQKGGPTTPSALPAPAPAPAAKEKASEN